MAADYIGSFLPVPALNWLYSRYIGIFLAWPEQAHNIHGN